MAKNRRIVNPKMVISDLEDPDGWTLENNKYPNKFVSNPLDPDDWRNWFEWDKESTSPVICHNCLNRAKIGSGNCQNGGEYFLCVTSGKRERNKRKWIKEHEVQTTLM